MHGLKRAFERTQTVRCFQRLVAALVLWAVAGVGPDNSAQAAGILAGVAKIEITDREAGPVNDPLHVRALVLKSESTTAVLVTVDAVAIGEIGRIGNDYLPEVRSRLHKELGFAPESVLVTASHCHGVVCRDVADRTVEAVKRAAQQMVPVRVGAGSGFEDRVMENRRLKLKDGREVDVRHAYSLAPDEEVAAVGPVDPEIGVLRFDRADGRTLAAIYNFACHPIQGVPSKGNTADMTGFACRVIENNLDPGTVALFLQGCAGDINPIGYKDVNLPRDAEPLGNLLGLSALDALRRLETKDDGRLCLVHEVVKLPRGDLSPRIAALEAEQTRLIQSLRGTTLNLKTFVPLLVKYRVSGEFPSCDSHRYLHERVRGRDHVERLDAENLRNLERYIANIHVMEELTRTKTNLALLRKHQAANTEAGSPTVDGEVIGLRIGEFVMVTFPGEPSVQVGLNIKKASPYERTFVVGYTNGYLYYAPTAEQLGNRGSAQEDCDCLLAPEWQRIYEQKAGEILGRL